MQQAGGCCWRTRWLSCGREGEGERARQRANRAGPCSLRRRHRAGPGRAHSAREGGDEARPDCPAARSAEEWATETREAKRAALYKQLCAALGFDGRRESTAEKLAYDTFKKRVQAQWKGLKAQPAPAAGREGA